ncbi:TIR domain-containing protein [Lactiplantibacillus pentosus]|uniref:TIR domain-containing protein n=1 Tax=Lactiplantibacillus pentosus TaxID=1589 RepID=UPI0021A30826|nr:TIR domain-containing protein [Lactiplantibacillus pentosus]MCT3293257.1 molecular chaperone Tir [Lactiplantibacillus pentosus]
MAYRNKVYVAFDGDEDMNYYRMIQAWAANTHDDFKLNNAHDLNKSYDDSEEESIKKQLRVRFANSKLFILLLGEHTKNLRKFVRWEIEVAIKLELPIIVVNIDKNKRVDSERFPTKLKTNLSISVPYYEKAIKYAMDNWPDSDAHHRKNNEKKMYYYPDSVYDNLGL